MFESARVVVPERVGGPQVAADFARFLAGVLAAGEGTPGAGEIGTWSTALGAAAGERDLSEVQLLDRIEAAERLKAAAAAMQARSSVLLERRVRERRAAAADPHALDNGGGLRADRVGVGPREVDPSAETAQAIALARGESPARGGRLLGLAKALVLEMPHTLNALAAGRTSEWRATLVARETACLDVQDRVRVDEAMVPLYARGGVGDRQVAAEARAHTQRLDPAAAVKRARRAMSERRVSVRPAPDSMAILSCLLPAAQAVAAYKALAAHADSVCAAGQEAHGDRTRDQIMVDAAVERLTGQEHAADVAVAVNLVMAESALLRGSAEPAHLEGLGVLPAQLGRELVLGSMERATLRRLFTAPTTGALSAMDSTARAFPGGLKAFIALRDATCRNPWCNAPIRQYDHITPAARGGPTSAENGQGLCERCNQVKEAPGWGSAATPAARHTVTVTTPTGRTYSSTAPPLPGTREVVGHRLEFPGGELVFHTAA